MAFLSVIRRWALRDKMPIREISRRTGLSRNTIRKYLREGAVEPKFKTPSRPSKLDPYADRLSAWLLAQTRKSRKERRTMKQMHADLVKLGYDGSYGRVTAFARAWRDDRHRAEQTTGRGTHAACADAAVVPFMRPRQKFPRPRKIALCRRRSALVELHELTEIQLVLAAVGAAV